MNAMTNITKLITRTLELDKAATPGPWEAADIFESFGIKSVTEHDTNLIDHYRTAAPELARECQRLQKELDKMKSTLDRVENELLRTDPGI